MTLQLRLSLVIVLMFFVGAGIILYRTIILAGLEVDTEVEAASELTLQLMALNLWDQQEIIDNDSLSSIAERFEALGTTRHIRLFVENGQSNLTDVYQDEMEKVEAPDWFIRVVNPAPQTVIRTLPLSNETSLLLYTTPVDGLTEAWGEALESLLTGFLALGAFLLVLVYLVGKWLKPVAEINSAISGVEQGDFSNKVPALSLPELNSIGSKVNHLSAVLGASKAENNRLNLKAQNIQEQERRYLAQELHDALGQNMSAIKAISVSLQQRGKKSGHEGVVESAEKVEDIADKAYACVRNLMRFLRPFELDELGLIPALQQMVDDWNDNHEDTFCHFIAEGVLDNLHEEQCITLYRIIQEALTNVAKYSKASRVNVVLQGLDAVCLSIKDNGVGFDLNNRHEGMGLQGLRDRVQGLQGELNIDAVPSQGVDIQITFPKRIGLRRRTGDKSNH